MGLVERLSALQWILSSLKWMCRILYLDVRKENIRAIRCYKGLGFETIHEGEKVMPLGKIKFQRMQLLKPAPNHRTKAWSRRREYCGFT